MKLEELVKELKEIALLKARHAGELAELANKIEFECCKDNKGTEYARCLAISYDMYAKYRINALYSDLDRRESEILTALASLK